MTLEEKIIQLETELEKVKTELAESKRTVWKPKYGDSFYYASNDGNISGRIFSGCMLDNRLIDMNNIFKCTTEIEQHLKWYNDNVLRVQNRLMQLHELLCPDYFPDWNNDNEDKYFIHFDNDQRIWKHSVSVTANPQTVMFTYEVAKKVCEILNAENFMMGDDS